MSNVEAPDPAGPTTRVTPLAQAAAPADQRRACDGCTVCCVVLRVHETQSPAFVPCRHLTAFDDDAHGCGDYAGRPGVCRTYACAWASGEAPEWMRPDVVGVLPGHTVGRTAILLTEVWPDASRIPAIEAFVREANARGEHVVVKPAPTPDAIDRGAPLPANRVHLFTGEVRTFDGPMLAGTFVAPAGT